MNYKLAICPKCTNKLCTNKKHISEGYSFACLYCDEDYYKIEVKEVIQ